MRLHCTVYILGPFISPSLTLLLVPYWFILSEELPSAISSSPDLAADAHPPAPAPFPALVLGLYGKTLCGNDPLPDCGWAACLPEELSLQVSSAWPALCLFPSQQHRLVSCTLYLRQPVINTPELGLSLGWKGLGKSRLSEPHSRAEHQTQAS